MADVARFRWGIAMAHAIVAVVIVAVVTVVLALALGVADPQRFGQGAGRLALLFGAGAFAASWLAQQQWKRAALVVRGVLVTLLLGTVIAVVALDARHRTDAPATGP